jgi:hypothetical protein
MRMKKHFIQLSLALLILVITFKLTQPQIRHFESKVADSAQPEVIEGRYEVYSPVLDPKIMTIAVNGCLQEMAINGNSVPWQKTFAKLCRADGPQKLDLKEYLKEGSNELSFKVSKVGDENGFTNLSVNKNSWNYFLFYGLFLIFTALCFSTIWQFIFKNKIEARVILVWSVAAFAYLLLTSWNNRVNDASAHLDYILLVYNNAKIPGTESCWQCFQMPGYYIVAAMLFKLIASVFHCLSFSIFMLQYLALWLIFIFLIGMRKIFVQLDAYLESRWFFLFVLTTPSLLLHAAQIGNDSLFYVFSTFALLSMTKFWKKPTVQNLWASAAFIFLALFTKATGLLVFASFVILFLSLALSQPKKSKNLLGHFVFSIAVICFFYFFKTVIWGDNSYFQMNYIMESLKIDHKFYHFLMVEPSKFFASPVAEPLNPLSGREYFWNYFIKSLSFGEFSINNKLNFFLAHVRNALIVVFYFCAAFFWTKPLVRRKALPILIFCICLFGGQIAFQFYHPYASSSDARLIYPAAILFLTSVIWEKSKMAKVLKYGLQGLVAIGVLFWLSFFISGSY